MSYESEVLADTPVLYYRLNQVGNGVDGESVPDSSGNGLDAELIYAAMPFAGPALPNAPAWGYPSPIETDSSSFEFKGWTNAVASSGLTGISRIERASDVLMQPTKDFACEAWLRPTGGMPNANDAKQTGKDNSGGIQWQFASSGERLGGYCYDTNGTKWTVADTSFDFGDFIASGRSWHVVVTRVADTLALYIDGTLRATTAITSGLNTQFTSDIFFIQPPVLSYQESRFDEVAWYTHSLSSARVLAHYEAALNATLLEAASNVIPSAILRSDFPATPVSFPFRHNWDSRLIERLSFRTNLSQARTGVEEGNQLRLAPRREIELTQVMRDNRERRLLRSKLWANQHAQWFFPVRQDIEQLETGLSAGTTTIPVTTAYKDYEVGAWIGLQQVNALGQVAHWEQAQITAINANSIECVAIVSDYDPYVSFAYPVRRAYIDSSLSVRGHTDSVEEVVVTGRLLAEDEESVPNRIEVWHPTLKYRDHEVFDPLQWQSNNWDEMRQYDVERAVDDVDYDVGIFSAVSDTSGAAEAFSYRMLLKGREQIARFLGWYYERVGSLRYLWVPTMQQDFEVLAADGNEITVEGTNYSDNFALAEPRRDLAFVYHDNTMEFRRVTGFVGVVDETLTLDADVPTLTNLRSVSLLKFCRLDADQLELAWETNDTVQVAWRFRETLHTPAGTGLSSLSPSASVSPSRSPSASASPSASTSLSRSPSSSVSPSGSASPSASQSPSSSVSVSASPSGSASVSPSASMSPSASASPSI